MAFINSEFPQCIAFGAQSEPVWRTLVAQSESGFESTDQTWTNTRHMFDVGLAVRSTSDYQLVRTHFHEVRGKANYFPFRDPLDYSVTVAVGQLLDANDLSAVDADGTYQLFKRYGSTNPYNRKITRPVSAINVFRTRAAVTTDITGAGAVVTYTTGAVAITGHVAGDTYAWSGEFRVPTRYDTDRLPTLIVDREGSGELLVRCDSIPLLEVRE